MKQNLFKSLLIALLAAMLPQLASAHYYDFMVDGLCYKVNSNYTSVTVTCENDWFNYPGHSSNYDNLNGDITIPSSVTYSGTTYLVTSIDRYAFSNCSSFAGNCGLTSVTIPNSVTSIGEYAFSYCSGLTSVTIPNSVTSIGESAFEHCIGLTSVTIPNSVTSIPHDCFIGCSGLTSVTIPNSVTSIGSDAFRACGLTSVTIPNSVTSIGSNAFYCSGLTSVTWNATNCDDFSSDKSPFSGSNINTFKFGSTVTKIPAYLCYELSGLTSVTIPNSVTSIGKLAFNSCSGLTSVTIPNSVKTIGAVAFGRCTGLTSVTIGNSVTSIGSNAFRDCTGLTSVTWNATNCDDFPDYKSPFSGTNIKTFNFGSTVTKIPASLCYKLSGLTSVTIPNSVTSIGRYAFFNCNRITSLTWNAVNCNSNGNMPTDNIEQLSIGNEVQILPSDFAKNSKISSVTIPNSVTSIGSKAFYACTGLTSVTIPNSVTTIGEYAFCKCSGLTSVTIGNSVQIIGYEAFEKCTGLTSLTIPYSVTSIGSRAFYDCSSLKNIYAALNPDRVQLGERVFYLVPYTCYLHVQEEYVNAFKAAYQWKDFINIIGDFIDESAIEEVRVDELDSSQPIDVYNMNGVKVAQSLDNLPSGIYIVRQGSKSAKIRK